MNDSFVAASGVEKQALADILPWLARIRPGWQVVMTEGQLFLQKLCGDAILRSAGDAKTVELKAERKWTGNLFLESWSNFGFRPGWLITSQAELLLYYFTEAKRLYCCEMKALRDWAFQDGHILSYAERSQQTYDQRNHTRGWLVKIDDLVAAVGLWGPADPVAAVGQAPALDAGMVDCESLFQWFKDRC
jgi:hypothetical protein